MTETPLDLRELEGAVLAERYRLERFLDEGAFGAVFRATHLAYGRELRDVAVKLAKRPMSDARARATFGDALQMARLTDAAADPALRQHFVTVHDAGRFPESGPLAGHPYVVMELVRGGSLKSCLSAGPFPLKRAAAYFDQVLEALAFMHGRALVHRDLKPGNVLVTRPAGSCDVLKVTDFGLAIEVDTLLGWVESGGDLAYLAPESFSHEICSPQSDVYMLGLVFYEMLIGRCPFAEVGRHLRGDDAEKRRELKRLHLNARQLESFAALDRHEELKQAPKLLQVVRKALAADMPSRYGSAIELKAAWEKARGGAPQQEPPAEAAWTTVRRLLREAEQCFAVGEMTRGEGLLEEALLIQRDKERVSDAMMVAALYLRLTERALAQGRIDDAGAYANEGFQRRQALVDARLKASQCRSTLLAMAAYYRAQDPSSALAARFDSQARTCPDQE
jgi:serine/threonine protein kinase